AARGLAGILVLEDIGVAALDFPGLEEGGPVDVFDQVGNGPVLVNMHARLFRLFGSMFTPVRAEGVLARRLDGDQRLAPALLGAALAVFLVVGQNLGGVA